MGGNHYFWSAINRFGTQALGLIGNILIARQLSPDDYGLIAMLAIILGVAWSFTESGFADCLIRKNNADKKDFGTVLSFNISAAIVLYVIIWILSPYIAVFFNRSELIGISKILGFSIVIKACTITEFARLRKELKFKTITIIQITSNILSITVAYFMALNGFGYWALVFQTITIGISNILLIILLTKYRPYFYFSKKRFNEISRFSFNLLLSYLTNQIGQNLYAFFIGKYHSAFSLGFYRQAQKLKDAPIMGLNAVILTTTYPLLVKETDSSRRFLMYVALLKKFLFLHFSVCAFLFVIAHPIIDVLLGEKWMEAADYFQLMIVAYLFYPLSSLNSNILKINNRAELYRNLTFIRNSLLVAALIITMSYSISIILYGQIVALYISAIIDIYFCGRIINFRFLDQIKIVMKQIWIPIIAAIITSIIPYSINSSLIKLILLSGVFLSIYIGLNEFMRSEIYLFFKTRISLTLKKVITK